MFLQYRFICNSKGLHAVSFLVAFRKPVYLSSRSVFAPSVTLFNHTAVCRSRRLIQSLKGDADSCPAGKIRRVTGWMSGWMTGWMSEWMHTIQKTKHS